MNEFFKNLFFSLVICAGLIMTGIPSANAACYTNTGHIPAGSPPLHSVPGGWCTHPGERVGPVGGVPISVGATTGSAGSPDSSCEDIGDAVGAGIGAAATHKQSAAVNALGAAAGSFLGGFAAKKMFCGEKLASAERRATCRDSSEIPAKLNLPGHPKNGDVVCMRPDDPNRARD